MQIDVAEAVRALGSCKLVTDTTIDTLVYALRSPFPTVNHAAAHALLELKPDHPEPLPLLIRHLRHADPVVREVAIDLLQEFRTLTASAIPELERVMQEDSDPDVRDRAEEALARIRDT
jgi:HEAT repeat protein